MKMTPAAEVAAQIQNTIGRLKSGSLRFWGVWFGRPHDNFHRIVRATALGDCLRIEFDEGEVLQVWGPDRCSISDQAFVIEQAHRVRWEWFYYGRPKTPENLYFQDFARDGDRIAVSTNADWFVDQQRAETAVAAVEIL